MGKKPWDDLREERTKRWFVMASLSCLAGLIIILVAGNVLIAPLKEIIILTTLGLHLWVVYGKRPDY